MNENSNREYGIKIDAIETGEKEGIFKIKDNKIEYVTPGKRYKITDPEEQVRASFYLELIKKYQYPKERIDLEVSVKGEKRPAADIVVYEDDEKKKPYIVVECKRDGISQAEIKQAIEEGIPNAHYLKAKYAIVVAGNVRIAFDIGNFPPQEREKNIIADIPVRYGKVVKYIYRKGGPKDKDDPSKELKEVTRDELLAKFQQCHDTLWEGGKRNPAEAFDEMSKLMYCKIQDERFLTKKGDYYRFQVGTYETINEVAERIKKIYKDAQDIDPEVFVESIKTDNAVIFTVAEILQSISLARTDLDVKGEGYEHFLGGVFRGAMGQYFTPRPIVSFIVNFLAPSIDDFVIDPACGSGGFLIYALEKVRRELFEKLDEKDAIDRWKDFALKQVYGIEINSQLARVSMMNMIIHEDGHTNIENNDALDNPEIWKRQKIRELFGNKFTLLLTNPPFGADIKDKEKSYLSNYELGGKIKKRNQQNTEILFIERCLDFLKPDGRMGIVLPDGILTNSSLQYVRDFITERAQILGAVSLPQTAFRKPSSKGSGDTGSGVKASLLFLRKKKDGEKLPDNYPIFMAIAEHIGYDSTGRPDKDEFPEIIEDWKVFRKKSIVLEGKKRFSITFDKITGKRFDPYTNQPSFDWIEQALNKSKYEIKLLKEIVEYLDYGLMPTQDYARDNSEGLPMIRVTNITPDGEINMIDMKYIKFDTPGLKEKLVKEKDILLVQCGNTTGKVAIIPKEYEGYTFGSFMFGIRAKKDIVDPYFLYIVLGSKLVQQQIWQNINISTVRPNTSKPVVENLKVPLPPLSIQQKISQEVKSRRDKTKQLKAEAQKILEETKAKVEKMILGQE